MNKYYANVPYAGNVIPHAHLVHLYRLWEALSKPGKPSFAYGSYEAFMGILIDLGILTEPYTRGPNNV